MRSTRRSLTQLVLLAVTLSAVGYDRLEKLGFSFPTSSASARSRGANQSSSSPALAALLTDLGASGAAGVGMSSWCAALFFLSVGAVLFRKLRQKDPAGSRTLRRVPRMNRPLSFIAFALTGCASVGGVQTAETLGKGRYEIGVEPGAQLASSSSGTRGVLAYPHFDAAFRYGVADHVDVGVRLGYSMLEFQSKFRFTRGGGSRPVVSLAPTVGGLAIPAAGSTLGVLSFAVPVLVGFKMENGHELVFSARVQNLLVLTGASGGKSASVYGLGLGGSVGYALRLGERLTVLPELAVVHPLLTVGTAGGAAGLGSTIAQFKVGVLYGSPQPAASPNGGVP